MQRTHNPEVEKRSGKKWKREPEKRNGKKWKEVEKKSRKSTL